MRRLRAALFRLWGTFRRSALDEELAEELDSHLQLHVDDNIRAGMTPEEAQRQAVLALGGVEQTKERYRDRRGVPLLEELVRDLRYAMRVFRKSPGFTVAAVVTLALGIGANTAVFSVIDGVLLNPLPFPEPDQLVALYGTSARGTRNAVSYPNFLDWQEQAKSFKSLGAWRYGTFSLTGRGDPELLTGQMVSSNFFEVLSVELILGRTFRAEEDQLGAVPVVMIGHGLWTRRFAADPHIVGKSLTLNGKAHTIVGVAPSIVRVLDPDAPSFNNDAFVPIGQYDFEQFRSRGVQDGTEAVGRLTPGVTLPEARAEMHAIATNLALAYPKDNKRVGVSVVSLKDAMVGHVRPILLMLLAAVGLVLLIACANVANLLLVRLMGRTHEFALRVALGAGRARVVRQLLIESVLLSLSGGAVGIVLAWQGTQSALAVLPSALPGISQIEVNATVLLVSLGVAVSTGILFGLVPALHTTRAGLEAALKVRRGKTSHHDARRWLVVPQVALTLVLLVATGLMLQSLAGLLSSDPGFNPKELLTFYTRPSPEYLSSGAKARGALAELEQQMTAIAGVESASVAIGALPFTGGRTALGFWVEGEPKPANVNDMRRALFYAVGPEYFETTGIPVMRGRSFTARDDAGGARVVVIDEELARSAFPAQDAIGQRIHIAFFDEIREVVGVVGHVKHFGLVADATARLRSQFYVPHQQLADDFASSAAAAVAVIVRSPVATQSLVTSIRQAIAAFDDTQVIFDARHMDDVVVGSLADRRFSLIVLGVFAAMALVLSTVGTYGVVAHVVAQRTNEFGIRMALGAGPGDVVREVASYGARVALAGSVIGVAGVLALSHLFQRVLHGVSATDPGTITLVTSVLFGVTLLACYFPARRATKVNPIVAVGPE